MSSSPGVSSYRLARAYAVRPLGIAVAGTGVGLLAFAVARSLDAPGWVAGVLLVALGLLAALTLLAAVAVLRPPVLLQLDADGYRVRRLTGTTAGTWRDVNDVTGEPRAGQPVTVVRHRDGRLTLLPVGLLEARAAEVEAEVRRRLNAAVSYRRVTPRSVRRGAPKPG